MSSILNGASLHHVSLPVTNVERSRTFYRDVLGLREIPRPQFDFPGAWFTLGNTGQQLHLIGTGSGAAPGTYRSQTSVDSRDIHFAIRVSSYAAALRGLRKLGYSKNADWSLQMKVSPTATAGFPQIYILDPDRHVIEINAEHLDMAPPELEEFV